MDYRARTWLHAHGISPIPLFVAAVLWVAWQRRPIAAADPTACGGLLDRILTFLLRALDDVSAGSLLAWTNNLIALAALVAFIRLLHALTRSPLVTAACAAAMLATPAFDRVLAPASDLAVLAAVSVAVLAAHRILSVSSAESSGRLQLIVAAGAIALIAPRLMLPAGVVIAWAVILPGQSFTRGRAAAALAAAAGVTGAAVLVTQLPLTGPPSITRSSAFFACVWDHGWSGRAREQIAAIADSIGPLPFGLAALGLFALSSGFGKLKWRGAVAPIAALLLTVWRSGDAASVMPLVAVFWSLVAIGLRELIAEGSAKRARFAAALVILALLSLLQVERLRQRDTPLSASVHGLGDISQEALWRTLRGLPDGSLLDEDASTDLLVRASMRPLQRSGKTLQIIPRNPRAVGEALAAGPVYAFPRAQAELQHRGVQFGKSAGAAIGLAEVDRAHPCTPLERRWIEAPAATITTGFALAATQPDARGPVTIYLGAPAPLSASPLGWRDREKRGFHLRGYATTELGELREALLSQGLPSTSPVLTSAHVIRLTMWRTPGAPAVLPVTLTERAQTAIARVEEQTDRPALELCASF